MKKHSILIVDDDKKSRNQLRKLFEDTHYEVDSTASAAYAIAKIVQKNKPIVILGDQFEEQISVADVVALMKRCDSTLKIILISDDSSLDILKKLREEGIFYHTFRPHDKEDNEEILSAVHSAQLCH